MYRIISTMAVGIALAASPFMLATSVAAQERLVHPPLDGFFMAYEEETGGQTIVELIPEGETLEDWTRMATTISLESHKDWQAMPFAAWWIERLSPACAKPDVFAPRPISVRGRDAAVFGMRCVQTAPHGGYELFMAVAIEGDDAMHMQQIAFRYPQSPEDTQAAITFLQETWVCDEDCPEL